MKAWIIVASRDHVHLGVRGGFCQACHGKPGPLRRMSEGDWVAFYSGKLRFGHDEPCRAFTAIGRVAPGPVHQVPMGAGFEPFRRAVRFVPSREAPIAPLIGELSFIVDKRRWSAPLRLGFLSIPVRDVERIAGEMGVLIGSEA